MVYTLRLVQRITPGCVQVSKPSVTGAPTRRASFMAARNACQAVGHRDNGWPVSPQSRCFSCFPKGPGHKAPFVLSEIEKLSLTLKRITTLC